MTKKKSPFTNNPVGIVHVDENAWRVTVEAVAERHVWGRQEFLMHPLVGSGEKWVRAERVQWLTAPEYPGDGGDGGVR